MIFFLKHGHIFHPQGTQRKVPETPIQEQNQQQVLRMLGNKHETKIDLCLKNPKYQVVSKMILYIAFILPSKVKIK